MRRSDVVKTPLLLVCWPGTAVSHVITAVLLWESASLIIKTSITKLKKGFEKRLCFDGWETEAAAAATLHFKLEIGKSN